MDVCACRYGREEELREGESESVTHCIQEDVWHKEGERIVGEYKRAKRLTEKSKVRPCAAENPMPGLKVKEDNGRRVKVNVEAIL